MAKECNCELCKMSRRIQAEWNNMTLTTQAIVEELYSGMANAEEDATFWRMRHHGQWPAHEDERSPEGTLKTDSESSAEMNLKKEGK